MLACVQKILRVPLVVLMLVALPAGQAMAYIGSGHDHEVECCCGTHAADDACGCPDCPAAVDAAEKKLVDEDDEALRIDRLHPCGRDAEEVRAIFAIDWGVPPAELGPLVPARARPGPAESERLPPSPVDGPEPPPF